MSEMDQPSPGESHPGTFLLPIFGAEGKNRKATSSNYNSDHFSLKTNKSPTPQEKQNSLPLTSKCYRLAINTRRERHRSRARHYKVEVCCRANDNVTVTAPPWWGHGQGHKDSNNMPEKPG